MENLRLGILGLGQIGAGLYTILQRKKAYFRREIGVNFDIRKIAVKSKTKKRTVRVPKGLLTTNALSVVRDPEVDVVVELIGGTREAKKLVMEALRCGKHVVTANKALLAECGDEIFSLAYRKGLWLFFEASVGGGIPVMKALREGLAANRIDSIHSIINGTSNYILTKMTDEGWDFEEALIEAQKKGYAEADPTLDINGTDAAHKLAILIRFAFGGRVRYSDIYCEGISRIRSEDIAFAEEFGYRIKLLAIAKRSGGRVEARVQPTLLPKSHILANVKGSFNAVLVRGDEVGDSLLYGRGAGPFPTASAVLSDLVDIAKLRTSSFEGTMSPMRALRGRLKVKTMSSILSRYYLRFRVVDRPGVLGRISQVLGSFRISISDCVQKERSAGSVVPLIMLTHDSHERDVHNAMRAIGKLNIVRGKSQVIRIEEG
ncbi:MAG: homoserine dehydrogenase [Candidatus Omnitrophota bacterium]|nr:homoserine dehydrogenase [Candidatus Omnitrophota bacterium]